MIRTPSISVLINSSAAWVHTDISHYANQRDVIDYMERLYPTKYDKARKRYIQNYDVVTSPEGIHRVWAATFIPEEDVRFLEDLNNTDSKTNDD
ncbi:hypothetical protein HII31_00220 [Pseudocercospora fuligena]|uniref:Uncharacterized protein n=1 Tax=Pseudocercospora fuligena TaxID=685502 RepID=A0A8H6RU68_9PEZI|nr:hypothetical protein HII31_00220 [Pseudocercospora fuligena]